jgi:tRNA threonylcarbamoyl adenosine modification protein (Sua5/YciO/YrdC/YwlC family)
MSAKFIKLYEQNPNEKTVGEVIKTLREGGLIIFPTDTVYGIGCDLKSTQGLKNLAQIKGEKVEKANFSFITDSLSNLSEYVSQLDTPVFKLLKRALPGPYTFILKGASQLPKPFKNKKTVGIRIPNNTIVQALVKALGNPIAVASLKDSDEIIAYTTDPEVIYENWKHKVAIVINGGYGGNIPSTVIDASENEIVVVREGKGSLEII